MASLDEINKAANDSDLRARLELAAAEAGLAPTDTASRQVVWDQIIRIVTAPLADGISIADAYAYADNVRREALAKIPPSTGSDPAAVTDGMIREAVAALETTP